MEGQTLLQPTLRRYGGAAFGNSWLRAQVVRLASLTILLAVQCAPAKTPANPLTPASVSVDGYDCDIMEPFLSRDGRRLFFNNRNNPPDATDIHWAVRQADFAFTYRGKLAGANSAALDGVPTASAQGDFCFISTRSYTATLATVHCGAWALDDLRSVSLQVEASPRIPGRIVFDIELSASGSYAVIADGTFTGGAVPVAADLRLLRRSQTGAFQLDAASDWQFAAINSLALEYAAGLSADGLKMCFTRLEAGSPSLWITQRSDEAAAFGAPIRIPGITGFVEACTFAPDGAIYFHRLQSGRYELQRAEAP